jgi:hypothetical protein
MPSQSLPPRPPLHHLRQKNSLPIIITHRRPQSQIFCQRSARKNLDKSPTFVVAITTSSIKQSIAQSILIQSPDQIFLRCSSTASHSRSNPASFPLEQAPGIAVANNCSAQSSLESPALRLQTNLPRSHNSTLQHIPYDR